MAYSAEQVKAYLARIGLSGELPLTAETLTRIVSAHYQTVPYENLFILSGTPLDLSPEALFQKIVLEHRGGFCFELNAALGELPEGLGFSVTHLAARFLRGEPEGIPMRRSRQQSGRWRRRSHGLQSPDCNPRNHIPNHHRKRR